MKKTSLITYHSSLRVLLLLLAALPMMAGAQKMKNAGKTVEELVPEGWTHQEAEGDLNKDGIADLVVIATPNFKEHMKTRDDGFVYNFNQPVMAIYFGKAEGGYACWKQYEETIPGDEDEYTFIETELTITERGVLSISVGMESSMGSYGNDRTTYLYRYQQGDFFLIGKESGYIMKNTGETTTISENYLTWKRQTIKDNAFEDAQGKRKETWTRLPKKPLERLGEQKLI